MFRNVFILFFMFSHLDVSSQETTNIKRKRISWGVIYSPAITSSHVRYNHLQVFLSDKRKRMEESTFGFNTGVLAQMDFGLRSAVEGALLYSVSGYHTRTKQLLWTVADPSLPQSAKFAFKYHHAGIQFRYRYVVAGRRVQAYLMPGLGMQALLQRKTTMLVGYADGSSDLYRSSVRAGYAAASVKASLSVGAKTQFGKRMAICVEPFYMRDMVSITPGHGNGEYLQSFGLNLIVLCTPK